MQAVGLNHAVFRSPDPLALAAYYEEVIGLHRVESAKEHVYLATRSGTDAVVVAAGDSTGLAGFALHVSPERSAADIRKALSVHGIQGDVRSNPHPTVAESVVFTDPNGFRVELLPDARLHAPGPVQGVAPLRLGHLALAVCDVNATHAFYREIFGFRVGDWIGQHFVFLRCNHEHHTLNFIQSDRSRMQHVAFEMQNQGALLLACEVLARANQRLMWGPVRHGPGHNIATYHMNPQGQIIELYAEIDIISNESLGYYDPRPWHADRPQRPKIWPPLEPHRDVWGQAGPKDFLQQGI